MSRTITFGKAGRGKMSIEAEDIIMRTVGAGVGRHFKMIEIGPDGMKALFTDDDRALRALADAGIEVAP